MLKGTSTHQKTAQRNATHHNTKQRQHNETHYNTIERQRSASQHNTKTTQRNATQHHKKTRQHKATHHNTIQRLHGGGGRSTWLGRSFEKIIIFINLGPPELGDSTLCGMISNSGYSGPVSRYSIDSGRGKDWRCTCFVSGRGSSAMTTNTHNLSAATLSPLVRSIVPWLNGVFQERVKGRFDFVFLGLFEGEN